MSNSPLISYTKLSPNCTKPRNHKIDTITIHCTAGNKNNTAKQIVGLTRFIEYDAKNGASCNYAVGGDGSVALCVDEANRSWCSSSGTNDHRAVTIEVASNIAGTEVNEAAYAALLNLVTDICKRNGIKKLVWSTSKNDRVNHLNGCNMTVHRDYANKSCPGEWLYSRHAAIAAEVNKRLGATATPTTPSVPSSGTTFKVGDEVTFTGTTHYTSAAATSGPACKPGKAKVTAVSAGAAHPYHLIAVSGGGSTVYGWVNAKDISGATTAAKAVAAGSTVTITAGAVYGGLSSARGAKVPSYVTGSRRYTVKQVAAHNGVQEALLSELNSWVALSYLTVV